MKFQTNATEFFGRTLHLPVVDKITYTEDGQFDADLSEDEVNDLLDAVPHLSIVSVKAPVIELNKVTATPSPSVNAGTEPPADVITPQIETNELDKSEDEKNDIGAPAVNEPIETPEELEKAMTKKLDEMNGQELKALAAKCELPTSEWGSLNKADLKEYLKVKLVVAA